MNRRPFIAPIVAQPKPREVVLTTSTLWPFAYSVIPGRKGIVRLAHDPSAPPLPEPIQPKIKRRPRST